MKPLRREPAGHRDAAPVFTKREGGIGMGEFVKKENIFPNLDAENFRDMVYKMAKPLVDSNVVKPVFPEEVIKREESFPTGLPGEFCGVAIPHTNPEFVNEPRISVATLKHPIRVNVMGGGDDETMEASVVFMLAFTEANHHMNLLQKLIGIIQDKDRITGIQTGDVDQIEKIVSDSLNKAS